MLQLDRTTNYCSWVIKCIMEAFRSDYVLWNGSRTPIQIDYNFDELQRFFVVPYPRRQIFRTRSWTVTSSSLHSQAQHSSIFYDYIPVVDRLSDRMVQNIQVKSLVF